MILDHDFSSNRSVLLFQYGHDLHLDLPSNNCGEHQQKQQRNAESSKMASCGKSNLQSFDACQPVSVYGTDSCCFQIAIDSLGGIFGVNKTYSVVQNRMKQNKLKQRLLKGQSELSDETASVNNETELPNGDPVKRNNEHYVGLHGHQDLEKTQHRLEDVQFPEMGDRFLVNLQRIESSLSCVRQCLEMIQIHSSEKEKTRKFRDELAYEWRVVAITLDRVFFFIYLTIILVMAVVSMAIIFPRTF